MHETTCDVLVYLQLRMFCVISSPVVIALLIPPCLHQLFHVAIGSSWMTKKPLALTGQRYWISVADFFSLSTLFIRHSCK